MATCPDREYHLERAREELDQAYRADVQRAAEAHFKLSALHMERLKLVRGAGADIKPDRQDEESDATATGGRVVKTRSEKSPYKVVLEHEGSNDTEHLVSSVRAGEELIRKETPIPPATPKRDSWNP